MTANSRTSIQPRICAYCQQEQVYQEGVGHLPHSHKLVVTNRAGEPYVVAWDDHYCALVFHPSDIEHYRVLVSEGGDFTCRGKSDGSRCWPFYQQAHCVHCDAVEASIDCGERPSLPVPVQDCLRCGDSCKGDYRVRYTCQSYEGRLPEAVPVAPAEPTEKERNAARLIALFDTPLTATEQRRANQLTRTYGK